MNSADPKGVRGYPVRVPLEARFVGVLGWVVIDLPGGVQEIKVHDGRYVMFDCSTGQ